MHIVYTALCITGSEILDQSVCVLPSSPAQNFNDCSEKCFQIKESLGDTAAGIHSHNEKNNTCIPVKVTKDLIFTAKDTCRIYSKV